MIEPISWTQLRWTLEDDAVDVAAVEADGGALTGRPGALGQERALSALDLGLGIRGRGFNIFVVGASGTGRTSTVRTVVKEQALHEVTPDDVILLYNFEDRDHPLAIHVPPGVGPKVRKKYETLVERMINEIEKAFESDTYVAQRQEIDQVHQELTDECLSGIDEEAKAAGFILSRAGAALTLGVADEEGNPLSEEAYEALTPEQKQGLEERAEKLQSGLEDAVRKVRSLERETEETLEKLARDTADAVVGPLFVSTANELEELGREVPEGTTPTPAGGSGGGKSKDGRAEATAEDVTADAHLHDGIARVLKHLEESRADVLNRLRRLAPDDPLEEGGSDDGPPRSTSRRLHQEEDDGDSDEPALIRYRVNVLVTHVHTKGAPVVAETHPTLSNLLGRIEHRVRGSETVTDFTRIKAGALYRANGGYLVLQAQDLLRDPGAWEGLKRAIKNHQIELDDPGEPGRMVTVAALRPEPVPLAVKVILIGTPDLYYALSRGDSEFQKLFKVKVDFDLEMERSADRIGKYLSFLVGLAHEEGLKKLSPSGAARVIEHAARVSHNQRKLTTRFGWMADLLREANFWAQKDDAERIARDHVQRALDARAEREGFLELRMLEDVVENRVSIEVEGEVTGQSNGLTVIDLGSYSFGMPVRITCRVGAGKSSEILDIERETELGGPIHTKGTLILRGILTDRFGGDTPIRLAATVCMEQNYSDIDGDSATLAEACALFSALADAPLRQDIAMTGSLDQRGRVQTVGGVNDKIEGFFRVCEQKAPDKSHGVILPQANVRDLMLDERVVSASKEGRFNIYPCDRLEDALELLTGRPWHSDDESERPLRPAILKTLRAFAELSAPFESGNAQAAIGQGTAARAAKSAATDEPSH